MDPHGTLNLPIRPEPWKIREEVRWIYLVKRSDAEIGGLRAVRFPSFYGFMVIQIADTIVGGPYGKCSGPHCAGFQKIQHHLGRHTVRRLCPILAGCVGWSFLHRRACFGRHRVLVVPSRGTVLSPHTPNSHLRAGGTVASG